MQILVNGFISGLTISLLALAFSVVFVPTGIFHVAMGGVYAIAPFITWTFMHWGWPWYIGVLNGILCGMVLSLACELFNHSRLEALRASTGAHLVSSLGVYIIIIQLIAIIWGNETKVLRPGIDSVIEMGSVIITHTQAVIAVISMCIIGIYYIWLQTTNFGLKFRALSDNPAEYALRGHSIRNLRIAIFGISGLICSISSVLISFDIGFDPQGGFSAVLLAVVAVIIGGRKSFMGPIIGGILLGILRAEAVWLLSARWQDVMTFVIFALFLLFRPNGILTRKGRLEAEI